MFVMDGRNEATSSHHRQCSLAYTLSQSVRTARDAGLRTAINCTHARDLHIGSGRKVFAIYRVPRGGIRIMGVNSRKLETDYDIYLP